LCKDLAKPCAKPCSSLCLKPNQEEMKMTKIALITGAGSGIGRASAIKFLTQGWNVALTGRRIEALQETVTLAGAISTQALCVPCDVTDADSVNNLFAQVKIRFGRLDFLFNNAGVNTPFMALEDLSVVQLKAIIDTNLLGPFLCTQGALRLMKAQDPQGGRIVNNGSVSATTPRPNSAPYTATKHAITGLTKSTMLDGRNYNIVAGQIDIGNAATPMAAKQAKGVPQADLRIAVEPLMDVEHVADSLLFMANLPLASNVLHMTIKASNMPFEGRG
jgi:NAD(P)-dependent dehydrogenase (short-subunit alcohol dehydrogenase family)